jgi:hypothetical protein
MEVLRLLRRWYYLCWYQHLYGADTGLVPASTATCIAKKPDLVLVPVLAPVLWRLYCHQYLLLLLLLLLRSRRRSPCVLVHCLAAACVFGKSDFGGGGGGGGRVNVRARARDCSHRSGGGGCARLGPAAGAAPRPRDRTQSEMHAHTRARAGCLCTRRLRPRRSSRRRHGCEMAHSVCKARAHSACTQRAHRAEVGTRIKGQGPIRAEGKGAKDGTWAARTQKRY